MFHPHFSVLSLTPIQIKREMSPNLLHISTNTWSIHKQCKIYYASSQHFKNFTEIILYLKIVLSLDKTSNIIFKGRKELLEKEMWAILDEETGINMNKNMMFKPLQFHQIVSSEKCIKKVETNFCLLVCL